jgi:Septum formation
MREPMRSGKFAKIFGTMLLLTGGLVKTGQFFLAGEVEVPLALSLLPFLFIVSGGFIYFRGRQKMGRSSAESVLNSDRPKVLYLRPFKSDASVIGQALSANVGFFPMLGLATDEEQLAEVVRPIGDLIAIGRPGENLPNPGAARLYSDSEEWQRTVIDRMQSARLVVIRAGSGSGILWELQKAREIVEPRNLLILIPRMYRRKYNLFREEAKTALGIRLPTLRWRWPMGRKGFFRFTPNWTPEFLPLRWPLLRRSAFRPLQAPMQFALKPVFSDHGQNWTRPPISKLLALAGFALCLFPILTVTVLVTGFGSSESTSSTPPASVVPTTTPTVTEAPKKEVAFSDLQVGDCIQLPNANEATTVDRIPCSQPHDVEVFAKVRMREKTLPSDSRMEQVADEACSARFGKYVGLPWYDSTLDFNWFIPTKESWAAGARTVLCVIGMSNGEKLTGSMQGAGR